MPKIGCGLDRLEWNKVLPMIQEIYADLDIQITIYHYEDDKKGAGRGRGNSRFDGYNHRDHRSPQSYSESGTHDAYASNRRGLPERLSYHPGGSVRPPYHSGDNRERRCQWQTKNPSLKPKDGESLRKDTNEGRAPKNPQKQESTSRNRSGDQETSKSDEKDQKPRDDIKQRSINEKHQKLNKKHEAYDKKENAVHNKSKEEQRECQEEMNVKESSHEYEEDTTKTGAAAQSETPPEFKKKDDVSQLAPAIESTKPTVQEHGRDCADDGGHTSGKKKKKKKKHKSKE